MNYNEYAATKIMGYVLYKDWRHFESHYPESRSVTDMTGDAFFPSGVTPEPESWPFLWVKAWHPDRDRNQLWLVLEKSGLAPSNRYAARPDHAWYVLCELALKNPASALEAICEAHQAHQETKR